MEVKFDKLLGKVREGDASAPVISKTYSELTAMVASSSLVIGQSYSFEFRTRHLIPNTTDYNEGTPETLIITAISTNGFGVEAASAEYPQDELQYEFVDSSGAGGDRGRIIYRKDTVNNIEMYEDWRTTKYRRWRTQETLYSLVSKVVVGTDDLVISGEYTGNTDEYLLVTIDGTETFSYSFLGVTVGGIPTGTVNLPIGKGVIIGIASTTSHIIGDSWTYLFSDSTTPALYKSLADNGKPYMDLPVFISPTANGISVGKADTGYSNTIFFDFAVSSSFGDNYKNNNVLRADNSIIGNNNTDNELDYERSVVGNSQYNNVGTIRKSRVGDIGSGNNWYLNNCTVGNDCSYNTGNGVQSSYNNCTIKSNFQNNIIDVAEGVTFGFNFNGNQAVSIYNSIFGDNVSWKVFQNLVNSLNIGNNSTSGNEASTIGCDIENPNNDRVVISTAVFSGGKYMRVLCSDGSEATISRDDLNITSGSKSIVYTGPNSQFSKEFRIFDYIKINNGEEEWTTQITSISGDSVINVLDTVPTFIDNSANYWIEKLPVPVGFLEKKDYVYNPNSPYLRYLNPITYRWSDEGKFGNVANGNYSEFEADGTLKMNGEATVWDDLPPMFMLASKVGATAPTETTFVGNLKQYTFGVNDFVNSQTEVLHGYKEGSDMQFHVHIVTNGLDATDRAVKYEIEYWIANIDGSSSSTTTITEEFTIPANTPDRTHFYFDWSTWIPGTGIKIGAYICCRFRRITATGTAPTNNPFVIALGVHHEKDTIGSRVEHTK